MYLKVEDVVDCLGSSATRKRRAGIDHLIGYDSKGPPVTINPVSAVRAPIHGCQDLRGEKVLRPNRHCERCNLEMHL